MIKIKMYYILGEIVLKIPSSLSREDAYNKKRNKIQALYRKNYPNVPGKELYRNNLNATYS